VKDSVKAVILAGGSGCRLWPLSRQQLPKQLLNLVGEATLLEATAARLDPLIPREDIWVVTSESLYDGEGSAAMRDFRTILEPVGRNTAPAIAVAALMMEESGGDPLMLVLPSDHLIRDVDAFHAALRSGFEAAREGSLVTFGIEPTRPDTGFGYIQAKEQDSGIRDQGSENSPITNPQSPITDYQSPITSSRSSPPSVMDVLQFTEKPDHATAVAMLASGDYYWNSGMFVWKTSVILEELEAHVPALWRVLCGMRRRRLRGESWECVIREDFASMPDVSIDYGVMEKSSRVKLVPCDIGWSDIGSWDAVYEVSKKDGDGNALAGDVIALDCRNSFLRSHSRLLAAVGIEDVIAVETEDAVLVLRRGDAQRVRELVDVLKERGAREYIAHRTMHRPWGSSTILEEGDEGGRVRRIEIKPGASLSLRRHLPAFWIVVSGTATVQLEGECFTLGPNRFRRFPAGIECVIENRGGRALRLIEVETPAGTVSEG